MANQLQTEPGVIESWITCQDQNGFEIRATVVKLSRHHVVFECFSPHLVLRTSQVLTDFKIILNQQTIYAGKAVVTSLVNTGTSLVCNANLDDSWVDVALFDAKSAGTKLRGSFDEDFRSSQ